MEGSTMSYADDSEVDLSKSRRPGAKLIIETRLPIISMDPSTLSPGIVRSQIQRCNPTDSNMTKHGYNLEPSKGDPDTLPPVSSVSFSTGKCEAVTSSHPSGYGDKSFQKVTSELCRNTSEQLQPETASSKKMEYAKFRTTPFNDRPRRGRTSLLPLVPITPKSFVIQKPGVPLQRTRSRPDTSVMECDPPHRSSYTTSELYTITFRDIDSHCYDKSSEVRSDYYTVEKVKDTRWRPDVPFRTRSASIPSYTDIGACLTGKTKVLHSRSIDKFT